MGHLAAGMAHDLNNLLAVVASGCEALEHAFAASDPRRECVADARWAAEQGALMTRYVLAFLRGEAGAVAPVDLVALARASAGVLGRLLGAHVKLVMDLPDVARAVVGHAVQFQHVLLNLAVNARDAMPEGGQLIIEVRDVPPSHPALRRRAGTARPYVLLAVTDTGMGMDAGSSSVATTKPPGKGTGLGLSIVRRIVAETGGLIEVFTGPGRGTRFEIYFPAAER